MELKLLNSLFSAQQTSTINLVRISKKKGNDFELKINLIQKHRHRAYLSERDHVLLLCKFQQEIMSHCS